MTADDPNTHTDYPGSAGFPTEAEVKQALNRAAIARNEALWAGVSAIGRFFVSGFTLREIGRPSASPCRS
jgi:hypothetical protein